MAITRSEFEAARAETLAYFARAGIILTEKEKECVEVADFGLSALETYGVQLVSYLNTDRVGAKEVVLTPGQICPEHHHPPVDGDAGKEETFRCRYGTMYLYVEGPPAENPRARVPAGDREHFTVWHEMILQPGDQYTIYPNRLHWFQAGPEGAIFSEFTTRSTDQFDVFTHPGVKRAPEILG